MTEPGIVIVGLGIAGLSAIEGIRSVDRTIPITVISDEPHYAYYRPRLSHLLGTPFEPGSIAVKPKEWYDSLEVRVMLGKAVEDIDASNRVLILDDGTRIHAFAVILSTGSSPSMPHIPGLQADCAYGVRCIRDVQTIFPAISGSGRAVIVGAGPLGLESGWTLASRGMAVTILDRGQRLLPRMLDTEASELLRLTAQQKGISVVFNSSVAEMGNGGVKLTTGEFLPCGLTLVCTGIKANIGLARDIGAAVNRGIVVDDGMRTSVPWIFSAGDAAEHNGSPGGTWNVAMSQGRIAGINASGGSSVYSPVPPSYTLMAMGTRIFSIGDVNGGPGTESMAELDSRSGLYRKLVIANGRIMGALLMGDLAKHDRAKAAVEKGIPLPDGSGRESKDVLAVLKAL